MARTVRDCAIMLEAMSGFDPKDSTSLDLPVPQWEAGLSSDLKGKRVGIPTEYRIDGVPAEIDALWEQGVQWLRDAGAEPVKISLPHTHMRCRPITSSPRPKPRPTSPAMTAFVTGMRENGREDASTTCMPRPAPPASAPRSSAAS